jgi:hypothetical protein
MSQFGSAGVKDTLDTPTPQLREKTARMRSRAQLHGYFQLDGAGRISWGQSHRFIERYLALKAKCLWQLRDGPGTCYHISNIRCRYTQRKHHRFGTSRLPSIPDTGRQH